MTIRPFLFAKQTCIFLQSCTPRFPVRHQTVHTGIKLCSMVWMQKMNQFMKGHIDPKLLRASCKSKIQRDISLGIVAISPLTFHSPHFQGRISHSQRCCHRIRQIQRLLQNTDTFLPLGQHIRQMFRRRSHPFSALYDPLRLGSNKFICIFGITAHRNR